MKKEMRPGISATGTNTHSRVDSLFRKTWESSHKDCHFRNMLRSHMESRHCRYRWEGPAGGEGHLEGADSARKWKGLLID